VSWSKSKDYWRRVNFLREKLTDQIRIKKDKVAQIEKALEGNTSAPYEWRDWLEFKCRPPDRCDPRPEDRVWRSYDEPYRCKREYACGIRKLEYADNCRKSFTRGISMAPVAPGFSQSADDSGRDNGVAPAYGPWRPGALPISHDEWKSRGYSVTGGMDLLASILIKSPHKESVYD
jgi:hypothetical protein